MIADHDTNVVFVADSLEGRFPDLFRGLKSILTDHGIPLRIIPGTRDIWCRDYMPIQVAEDRFVQFRYEPDYLRGKYRHLRLDGKIGPTLPWVKNCVQCDIVLDGGNVVKWTNKVIMTEKVFVENPRWHRRELIAELERLLEVDRVILIPPEPGDVTGHADGVIRFVDEENVLVNDYRQIDCNYRRKLLRRVKRAGLKLVEMPYRPDSGAHEGMPSAIGNYVNLLRLERILIMPIYELPEDECSRRVVRRNGLIPTVESLNCRRLAVFGGALNCVTWQYKTANKSANTLIV